MHWLWARSKSRIPAVEFGPQLPDDTTVNVVLDLAMRIGEIQMYCGAGASDVTATIMAVTRGLGLPQCEVDVILTSITVTCHRGARRSPVTVARIVQSRSNDYSRLGDTEDLVAAIVAGEIDAEAAQAEVRRIAAAPHPYPRWVRPLAWGGMAAFIAVLLGGDFDIAASAMIITIAVDRTVWLLSRISMPPFFQQLAGGVVVTVGAAGVVSTGLLSREQPTLLVAAALTVLLSGMTAVAAIQDAITGFNVTAAGRMVEIAVMSAGLITGVVIALELTEALGFPYAVLPDSRLITTGPWPAVIIGSIGAAMCFALASYSRLRAVAVAAVVGGIGGAVLTLLRLSAIGPLASAAIAATAVGLTGGLISRRLRIMPLVAAMSGIAPMVPGLSTYRGMYEFGVSPGGSAPTLATAVGISLGLAAGVVLGEFLAQPSRTGLKGRDRQLAGPRLAGPLDPSGSGEVG